MRRLFTAAAAFMLACAMTAGMASCGDKEKSESSVSGNTLVGGQKPAADQSGVILAGNSAA